MTSATLATKFMMSLLLLGLFMGNVIHARKKGNSNDRNRKNKRHSENLNKRANEMNAIYQAEQDKLANKVDKNDLENKIEELKTDYEMEKLKDEVKELKENLKYVNEKTNENKDRIDENGKNKLNTKQTFLQKLKDEKAKIDREKALREKALMEKTLREKEAVLYGNENYYYDGEDIFHDFKEDIFDTNEYVDPDTVGMCQYNHEATVVSPCDCYNVNIGKSRFCSTDEYCLARHGGICTQESGLEMEKLEKESPGYYKIVVDVKLQLLRESDREEFQDFDILYGRNDQKNDSRSYYTRGKEYMYEKYVNAKKKAKATYEWGQKQGEKAYNYGKEKYDNGKEEFKAAWDNPWGYAKDKLGGGMKYVFIKLLKKGGPVVLKTIEVQIYNKLPSEHQKSFDRKIMKLCTKEFAFPLCGGARDYPDFRKEVINWIEYDGYKTYECREGCQRDMKQYAKKEEENLKEELKEGMSEEEYKEMQKREKLMKQKMKEMFKNMKAGPGMPNTNDFMNSEENFYNAYNKENYNI